MERIESFDTLKGLAIFAVIIIHSRGDLVGPFIDPSILDFILLNSTRFAIPVFFLISGFLFKKKLDSNNNREYTLNYLKKLMYYYIFASGLYLISQVFIKNFIELVGLKVEFNVNLANTLVGLLYNFFYTGYLVETSLWFFPALIISITLVYLWERYDVFNILLILSALMHITAILTNSYEILNLTIPRPDGLFFGLFYTCAGFKIGELNTSALSKHQPKLVKLTAIAFLLNLLERYYLDQLLNPEPFFWGTYTFFTFGFGASLLLLAISKPNLGKNTRINTYGKYTLLGYIFHIPVLALVEGTTIGLESVLGLPLMASSAWSFLTMGTIYIVTMESVIIYRQKNIDLRQLSNNWRPL